MRAQIHCPREDFSKVTLIYFLITWPGSSTVTPPYQRRQPTILMEAARKLRKWWDWVPGFSSSYPLPMIYTHQQILPTIIGRKRRSEVSFFLDLRRYKEKILYKCERQQHSYVSKILHKNITETEKYIIIPNYICFVTKLSKHSNNTIKRNRGRVNILLFWVNLLPSPGRP